jgi:putative hydrolase of the HAD superfamily
MLRYLLFDLDNTLYPASTRMEDEVLRRILEFSAAYLGVGFREAQERRHRRAADFGTTLEWLMGEEGFTDVESYFSYVHPEGEEACIPPDPALGPLLDSMPFPKAVFTNSPREHADRVLAKLGVADRFEAVYDIRYCGLRGKPRPEAFLRVCQACGATLGETLFADDLPRYVEAFVALGGRGVLVDELGHHADSELPRIKSLAELPAIVAEK